MADLDDLNELSRQVTLLGDIDGDGGSELLAGQNHVDDGGPDHGAAWTIFLPEPSVGLMLVAGIGSLLVLGRWRSWARRR